MIAPADFSRKVDYAPTCHLWVGASNNRGYGIVVVDGKKELAHRVAHEDTTYEAPMPLCVRCGEPATDWVLVLRASLASCSTAEARRGYSCPHPIGQQQQNVGVARHLLAGASVRMNGLSLLGYVVMTVMVCAWFLGARKGLWR